MKKMPIILGILALLLLPSMALAAAPVANFTMTPTTGYAPLTIRVNDTSTGVPTEWIYFFGDGHGNITTQNGTYKYTEPGTYDVMLYVNNSDGNNTTTKQVTVNALAPLAVAPVVGSGNNLNTYESTADNVSVESTSSTMFASVKSSIGSGYLLFSLGALVLGAVAIFRYLNYI
jgi:PKD repeat protein